MKIELNYIQSVKHKVHPILRIDRMVCICRNYWINTTAYNVYLKYPLPPRINLKTFSDYQSYFMWRKSEIIYNSLESLRVWYMSVFRLLPTLWWSVNGNCYLVLSPKCPKCYLELFFSIVNLILGSTSLIISTKLVTWPNASLSHRQNTSSRTLVEVFKNVFLSFWCKHFFRRHI